MWSQGRKGHCFVYVLNKCCITWFVVYVKKTDKGEILITQKKRGDN